MTAQTLLQKWCYLLEEKEDLSPHDSMEINGIIDKHYNLKDLEKIYSYFPNHEVIFKRIKNIFEHSEINKGIAPKKENLKGKEELIILAKQDIEQRIYAVKKIVESTGKGQDVLDQLQNISIEYINDFKKIKKLLSKEGFNFFDSLLVDYQYDHSLISSKVLRYFWSSISWTPFEWFPLSYHISFPITTLPELSMDKAVEFWSGGGLGVFDGDKYLITTRTVFSDFRAIEGNREARKLLKNWQEACLNEELDSDEIDDYYMLLAYNNSDTDLKKIFSTSKNASILAKTMRYIIEQGLLIEAINRDASRKCSKEEFLKLAKKDKEAKVKALIKMGEEIPQARKLADLLQSAPIEYINDIKKIHTLRGRDIESQYSYMCIDYTGITNIEENSHAYKMTTNLLSYILNNFDLESCMMLASTPLAKENMKPIIDFWAYGGEAVYHDGKYLVSSEHPFTDE